MKYNLFLLCGALFLSGCSQRESGPVSPQSVADKPPATLIEAPMPTDRINFADKGIGKYLRGFWPEPNPGSRWTNSQHVEISMAYNDPAPSRIIIVTGAFLVPGKIGKQRMNVSVNGKTVGMLEATIPAAQIYTFIVPANTWTGANIVALDLPDADSPIHQGVSNDDRTLALIMETLTIEK